MLARVAGIAVLLTVAVAVPASWARDLTFDERVRAQEAIERVYYSHQRGASLPFEQAVPRQVVEDKVRRYLQLSAALEQHWGTRVTAQHLHRELERIATRTRLPGRLRQIFEALDRDALLVQECFARPALVERLARSSVPAEADWDSWWRDTRDTLDISRVTTVAVADLPLPEPEGVDCLLDDTWRPGTFDDLEQRQAHSAVWTGTRMLIWGGQGLSGMLATGHAYDPLIDSWTPMSVAGAPSPRVRHTAVWTGSRMIVWGGWDGTYSGTGGRYDPASDTWAGVSTSGAAAARENHTAIWTGDEMIVWGGRNGPKLNSGGRYDPVGDSWTSTSLTDAPTARQGHSVVWTTKRMIIWGGSDTAITDSGGEYNPVQDKWTAVATSGAPQGRQSHTAVWSGDRMIVWGGTDASFNPLATGGRYNPNNGSWTPTTTVDVPEARNAHTAVWTGDLMVVWGGVGNGYLDTGGRYDPDSDSWSPTTTENAPVERFGQTVVWTGSRMIVWGGRINNNLSSGGVYDPVSDLWTPTAPGTPESRTGHSAVWTGTHMIVWGGSSNNLGELDSGGRYDPLIDTWTPTTTTAAPAPRSGHTAVWTGSRMVVWGGGPDTGGRYFPLIDSWTPMTTVNAPSGRWFHTAVWTGDEMIVWGGFPDLSTGGRYDPVNDVWSPTATTGAPLGRYWHTAVWTGSRMVMWGGYREPVFLGSGAQYDPVSDAWTPTWPIGAPEGRAEHTAVWTGDRMVVWGGNNLTFSGEGTRFHTGGIYDPVADGWAPTSTVDAPLGRDGHSAVWTGNEMLVWAGQAGPPFTPFDVNSGGRYDPQADVWAATSTNDVPSARKEHTAVWTGSDMLIWGGYSGSFFPPNEQPTSWGKYALGHAVDDDGDGFTECDGDCDDTLADIYPGAPELCDNRDNDCDGALAPDEVDSDTDGSPFCADCDDADPLTYPGAPELCDNLDNDCDSVEDEYITVCGLGECIATGFCSAGVDSCTPGTPSAEICDSLDNDCDGTVPAEELDDDGDGLVECAGDCDDTNAHTYPGALEVNDGHDNQCSGETGFGLVDELSGQVRFTDPNDHDVLCWPFQAFAIEYEASRSDAPDQPINCARGFVAGLCWTDPVDPPSGGVFYYLVRPVCQYAGSLGADSAGIERVWGCELPDPGCPD